MFQSASASTAVEQYALPQDQEDADQNTETTPPNNNKTRGRRVSDLSYTEGHSPAKKKVCVCVCRIYYISIYYITYLC